MIEQAAAAAQIVGSLFGMADQGPSLSDQRKEAEKLRASNNINTGTEIRKGAEKSGFNPLTYLAAMGGSGAAQMGGASGGTPPLASFQMLASGISDLGDQRTSEAADDAQEKKAIGQLQRVSDQQSAVGGIGNVVKKTLSGTVSKPAYKLPPSSSQPSPSDPLKPGQFLDADRPYMRMEQTDGPGVTTIDNDLLPSPIHLPGSDGEPWGFDEVLTGLVFGVPQILYHGTQKLKNNVKERKKDYSAYPDPQNKDQQIKTDIPGQYPGQR